MLASLVNSVDSGQLYTTAGMALHTIFHSERVVGILLTLDSLLIYLAVWIFVRNVYSAILRRALLETRLYNRLPMSHLMHFKMVGRWLRVSLTLLLQDVLEGLWYLTIVGGFIKRYSYYLVPYIAAENPDIRPMEAIRLSRRMMNGHKWECCKLELSFLGWRLLGFVTFGVTEALWSIPYEEACGAELYARLRSEAKAAGLPGSERLDDDALFERAAQETLNRHYADILEREDLIVNPIVDLTPVQRFFAQNFGIWLGSTIDKRIYSRQEGLRHQAATGRLELSGEAYPERLNRLWTREAAALTGKVSYLKPCSVWSLILVFMIFSIFGWVWEVGLHLMTHGVFVNRGVLHGPWLPIYGGGVTLIAVLLFRFREKPALEGLAIVVLCGIVEYMTSYLMEQANGLRWWDYTGYYLNLNGRICGEGLAVFAVGGMLAVYVLVPVLDEMLTHVSLKVLAPLCIMLTLCFTYDLHYSHAEPNMGEGITDDAVTVVLPDAGTISEA
ncbi:MAG: DUF975 family protein [Clostridia bacterium]|nr:DUF975 family protein [Clostridia bacterium]